MHGFELAQRRAEHLADRTLDEPPVGVRLYGVQEISQVLAHEELVAGRDRPFSENGQWHFQVRRAAVYPDQRTFARLTHQRLRPGRERHALVRIDRHGLPQGRSGQNQRAGVASEFAPAGACDESFGWVHGLALVG